MKVTISRELLYASFFCHCTVLNSTSVGKMGKPWDVDQETQARVLAPSPTGHEIDRTYKAQNFS